MGDTLARDSGNNLHSYFIFLTTSTDIITGRAEIISEPKRMIPYLQMHIDKYRVPRPYGEYASMNNRKEMAQEKYGRPELEILRICCITPNEMTGRSIVRTNSSF